LPLAAGMLTLQLQTMWLFADTAFHRFVWSAAAEVALTHRSVRRQQQQRRQGRLPPAC
jgi:hypothetical protein